MNALIFYHYSRKLTGSTFNAFEYYITILEHNPEFKLILINATKSDIEYYCSILENRYNLEDIDYKSNIINYSFPKIVHLNKELEKVLILDYGTVFKVKPFLKCEQIIHLAEKTENPEYRFKNILSKVTVYGEMPFAYKDIKYRMKLAFNRFKRIHTAKEAIYINAPFCKDYSFIQNLDLPNKPIIYKAGKHLSNLFEHFDEYIYYHVNEWFDPHPRLFLECAFYNKRIRYYNPLKIKDGSYYRYKDLMENGLRNRTLDKNDEIVRIFI